MNNRIVEDAIELHTDAGVKLVGIPGESNIARVGGMILQLMEAAGYESIKPQHGAVFAFAPKVYEDELCETPFDDAGTPLPIPMTMIPGTRITRCAYTGISYYGRIYQYSQRRLYEFRLRPAGGE